MFAAEPWPRGYESQVREAYLANPVAQRAVRLVAESVAWAPLFASDAREDAARLVPPALLERVATQLLLHGNAFVQVLQDGEGLPAELFALRPERVTIAPELDGWRLVTLNLVRSMIVAESAGRWAMTLDYRARMLAG